MSFLQAGRSPTLLATLLLAPALGLAAPGATGCDAPAGGTSALVPTTSDAPSPPEDAANAPDAVDTTAPPEGPALQGVVGRACGPDGEVGLRLVLDGPDASPTCDRGPGQDARDGLVTTVSRDLLNALPASQEAPAQRCLDGVCVEVQATIRVDSWDPTEGARGRWSIQQAGESLTGTFSAAPCGWTTTPTVVPVRGVEIRAVTLTQGVDIPLFADGAEVSTRPAPVIAERAAVVRVGAVGVNGWPRRTVTARLQLGEGDDAVVIEAKGVPGSTDGTTGAGTTASAADATFTFDVPAGAIRPGRGLALSLVEQADCPLPALPEGAPSDDPLLQDSGWPSTGPMDLQAQPSGPVKVVLVPIRYDADGSGRLPDVSPERVAAYKAYLENLYPATEVELSVREQGGWSYPVKADGTGWGELLQALTGLRNDDGVPADVYYYGLFEPAPDMATYCGFQCVAGLSIQPEPAQWWLRASIGLAYPESAANTMAHELGHAHGRPHSPCGTTDAPPGFPYPQGDIGTWGYDMARHMAVSPEGTYDVMGYCDPTWVSDYTYRALFDRIVYVNAASSVASPAGMDGATGGARWRTLWLPQGAPPRWGTALRATPVGGAVWAQARDVAGAAVAPVPVFVSPVDHLGGRLLLVPEDAPERLSSLTLPGERPLLLGVVEPVRALTRAGVAPHTDLAP